MFDIFNEYKDNCFYGIEEVFNGLSEIIKTKGGKNVWYF